MGQARLDGSGPLGIRVSPWESCGCLTPKQGCDHEEIAEVLVLGGGQYSLSPPITVTGAKTSRSVGRQLTPWTVLTPEHWG